jgi:hypothetical protein
LALEPGEEIPALLASCRTEVLGALIALTLDQPETQAFKVTR